MSKSALTLELATIRGEEGEIELESNNSRGEGGDGGEKEREN